MKIEITIAEILLIQEALRCAAANSERHLEHSKAMQAVVGGSEARTKIEAHETEQAARFRALEADLDKRWEEGTDG